ncbi:hypothetical protein [Caballeronia hypogeia]|uniref:hypothetical protein n=1 Tax=Caballeronia hypogeia TaxID=1777140 RepID=UPI0012FE725C|nr:hypothetical protein [Caballeronia hypogeia]
MLKSLDMLPYKTDIQPPSNPEDFDECCWAVHSEPSRVTSVMRVARSGQEQRGIDLLITRAQRSVGAQCERKKFNKLTRAIIDSEVAKADAGTVHLDELEIATTAFSCEYGALCRRATSERRQVPGNAGVLGGH